MSFIGNAPKVKSLKYTPQSAAPTNAQEGQQFYSDGTALSEGLYVYKNSTWQSAGSGSGGINYIENPDAEADTTGYATYADAAAANPVDGTGGSATTTFTRNTTTPLRGTGDFKITKDAANRQGEGVSYDFTIDIADKAQKLTIAIDYDASAAGYADDDIRFSVYDITNATLIRINGEDLKGGKGTHYAQFQTASNSVSYRLIAHISSVNATAYNIFMDNIQVGPGSATGTNQEVIASGAGNGGASITADTTNIDFTETYDTTASFDGTTFTAPETGTYTIEGAIRFTANTADSLSFYINGTVNKLCSDNPTSVLRKFSGVLKLEKGDDLTIRHGASATLSNNSASHHITIVKIGTSDEALSSDLGGRDIIAEGAGNGGTSITANVTNIDFTETRDTTASFDGTTFTVPETGEYTFSGMVRFSSSVVGTVHIYINGTVYKTISEVENNSFKKFSYIGNLSKGVLVTFRTNVTVTLSNDTFAHRIYIAKLASPQSVLETATVAARYTSNAGQSIPTSTDTIIDFEDIDYDTHGAVTTGASWKYTINTSGFYHIDSVAYFTGAAGVSLSLLSIYKNGVQISDGILAAPSGGEIGPSINFDLMLEKGDYIDIRAFHDRGSNATLSTIRNRVSFNIHRIK